MITTPKFDSGDTLYLSKKRFPHLLAFSCYNRTIVGDNDYRRYCVKEIQVDLVKSVKVDGLMIEETLVKPGFSLYRFTIPEDESANRVNLYAWVGNWFIKYEMHTAIEGLNAMRQSNFQSMDLKGFAYFNRTDGKANDIGFCTGCEYYIALNITTETEEDQSIGLFAESLSTVTPFNKSDYYMFDMIANGQGQLCYTFDVD
jgi:hypothetical protein